jgi:ubiquinone/menaquinone biosynthesis C-methylase UbiE
MRLRDAVGMIAESGVGTLGPTTWADLGCGDGTFTRALAECLAAGSTIHAIDRDTRALRRIPAERHDVRIETHHGDFTALPWPFADLDGILMANALHFIRSQAAFIRQCAGHMKRQPRFIVVEYDTDEANPWVPYPVSRARLGRLFRSAGYASVTLLGSRPSVYQRVPLYAALMT